MKRSLNELIGYSIKTKNDVRGSVKDFLFDEKSLILRYLEVDFGIPFSGKKVLIPEIFLKEPNWFEQYFPVELTTEVISKCPLIEDHLSVSRKYEEDLNQYYNIGYYWTPSSISPAETPVVSYPPLAIKVPNKFINEKNHGTKLMSFKEIKGCLIETLDGKSGHIDDIIINDIDWHIGFIVIYTSTWLSRSKKVLIPRNWINEISYVEKKIKINLESEVIESAPDFEFSNTTQIEVYEKYLSDYFKTPLEHY